MTKPVPSLAQPGITITVPALTEKRKGFVGRAALFSSRWPFKAEGINSTSSLSAADSRVALHQERSTFVT